jgi:penicillin-insensitive murein endopeptidase
MPRSLVVALAVFSAALLVVQVASATPPRSGVRRRGRAPQSRSVGFPWEGRLRDGEELRESETVHRAGEMAPAGNFWGTHELVQLIERAARVVQRRVPGGRLTVGELSRRTGGEIDGHGSHESGRDVDLSFYMLDGAGQPYEPFAFAAFDGNGQARAPNEGLRFDDARNWELVARLVADADARVQYIFVSAPLRARLLAEGRRRGASGAVLERAELVLVQPARGNPHRSHFHVRVFCDPSDRPQCVDRAPFWPWYPGPIPPGE